MRKLFPPKSDFDAETDSHSAEVDWAMMVVLSLLVLCGAIVFTALTISVNKYDDSHIATTTLGLGALVFIYLTVKIGVRAIICRKRYKRILKRELEKADEVTDGQN